MTKQEIIDAFDVARRMQELMELLPETLFEAHNQMSDAVSEILCDVVDAEDALDIILQALKTPAADQTQLRELIEENGRLKRELDAARNEKNAITITANKRIDEISHLQRELEAANEREAKMMVRIAELTPEPIEEEPDPDEEDEPEPVEAKPEKKKRAYHGCHKWTQTEDDWIAAHLNSARSREVAERFGVSEKAAYTRMTIVRDRLGK